MSALTIHTDHSLARFCSRPLLACASVWIFGITAMTCGSATREALVRLLLGYACLVLSLGIGAATADPITQRQDAANLARIRQLLAQPESQIDTARAELEIERMIDPSIDVDATLRKLDAMAASVQAVLPPKASSMDKMEALRSFLYQPGTWNQNNPFRYDLSDPMGTKVENKLLPNYLDSRRGNCVSMPSLFIALGQRLGLHVTAARAPHHFFVKFRDDSGKWFNLETTGTGAPTADASYQKQAPMTQKAITNGVYMRPLGKRETITVYLSTLMQFYALHHQYEQLLALTDLVLNVYPNTIEAILYRGNAYGSLQDALYGRYQDDMSMLPAEERPMFNKLGRGSQVAAEQADAIGWQEDKPVQTSQYRQRIENAKSQ